MPDQEFQSAQVSKPRSVLRPVAFASVTAAVTLAAAGNPDLMRVGLVLGLALGVGLGIGMAMGEIFCRRSQH